MANVEAMSKLQSIASYFVAQELTTEISMAETIIEESILETWKEARSNARY